MIKSIASIYGEEARKVIEDIDKIAKAGKEYDIKIRIDSVEGRDRIRLYLVA